jgi:predicted DNA binding CopG/RHH family protein
MKEDKLLEDAYAKGNLKLETPTTELLALLSSAGENTFKKDKRINIRLSRHDLEGIQRKAAREGLPYQAMISGLIHKYIEGDLVDRNSV